MSRGRSSSASSSSTASTRISRPTSSGRPRRFPTASGRRRSRAASTTAQIPVFTIDPDDAKDFDDALSIEDLGGGEVRVGIHIADVSTYVQPGTAIDREARNAGQLDLPGGHGHPDAAGEALQRTLLAGRGPGPPLQGGLPDLRPGPADPRTPTSRTRSSAAASASPTSRPTPSSSRTTWRRSAPCPCRPSTRPAPPAGRCAS